MTRPEREPPPRQGVVLPETPSERRQLEGLEEDLRTSPLRGNEIRFRLRNFTADPSGYLVSLGGPLPYMLRLRAIDEATAGHEQALASALAELRRQGLGDAELARRWRDVVEGWSFDEVNDLIERHNRWYPVESRLPMDPKRGDYALVNGRDYRRHPLGADWALERFPVSPAGGS